MIMVLSMVILKNFLIHTILTHSNGKCIDYNRQLDIITWGIKKHDPIDCDIIFDCSLFLQNVMLM